MLEINANLRYSLKRVLANLKKSEWQASEKYLTSMLVQCMQQYIVRGAAPISREEGSFELDPYWAIILWVAIMTDCLKKAVKKW